jgi:hypothetical protein
MNNLRIFVKSIIWVEFAAMIGLLVTGLLLTWTEHPHYYGNSFFTYRIHHLNYLPAWFIAALMLMAINGFWMFRLSNIEGIVNTPYRSGWGEWGASFPINPLRLFAINLIAIPVILALFMIIRANGW